MSRMAGEAFSKGLHKEPSVAGGKKFSKTVTDPETGREKTVRYGASGYKIKPGTEAGDSYCARSNGIKGDWRSNPNSPNNLSRKKWGCVGDKSYASKAE